jgi:hypothetical protein
VQLWKLLKDCQLMKKGHLLGTIKVDAFILF